MRHVAKTLPRHKQNQAEDANESDGVHVANVAPDVPSLLSQPQPASSPMPCGHPKFPIVGIGASAGGLKAFEDFFSGFSGNTRPGMAFVLIQHLAPDHSSILAELVRRFTNMAVFEVTDGMVIEPNHVYIIPPNSDMAILGGALHLLDPIAARGHRLPIDFFFRSLAQDQHDWAIGVILSGTGSDGTLGIRAIKGEGGLVVVQKPESTEFDGMVTSSIETGLVDRQLMPSDIPEQLLSYAATILGKPHLLNLVAQKNTSEMRKIFILLRDQTGHDFSQYKPSTIHRRIERRMAVHNLESIEDYVRLLQQVPLEVQNLFRDLLIGVTNFFRDPGAFKALEQKAIPVIFSDKNSREAIRVWIPGCSTGEEAYSVAILMLEKMGSMKKSFTLQIFATDIDARSIASARTGIYPANIASDISKERLERFFSVETSGAYRIRKNVRDLVVFSEQDMVRDPPFSNLDLICCRNVLIYMSTELQSKVFPIFHFAMKPGGFLFLGTSEAASDFDELFSILDAKFKLYQKKKLTLGDSLLKLSGILPPLNSGDELDLSITERIVSPMAPTPREQTEQALLDLLAPASCLINTKGDILYLRGRAGMYLEPAQGEPGVSNILKMAKEGLLRDLQRALHLAVSDQKSIFCPRLQVKTNGHFTSVNLTVFPVPQKQPEIQKPAKASQYLVVFEETADCEVFEYDSDSHPNQIGQIGKIGQPSDSVDSRISALRQELRAKEEFLRSVNEELESSSEELKSSNEEMQSVNEELQSSNEELATSKEEMQSLNEELATVNAELQNKVLELSNAVDDMSNLLAGTGIATIFVDLKQCILRFNPAATRIINLVQGDAGRPIGHFVANLVGEQKIGEDVKFVLDTLKSIERNVQTIDGSWLTMRILPYRTVSHAVKGAAITFVDITEMIKAYVTIDELKKAQETLKMASTQARLAAVVRDAHDAITMQGLDGMILAWNPSAVRMYGWTESEALQMKDMVRIPPHLQEETTAMILQLVHSKTLEPHRTQRLTKQGIILDIEINACGLLNEAGEVYAISTTERLAEVDRG